MNDDQTPINARPPRRPPEALEDLSLALREHLVWPVHDRLLGLGNGGRAAVAGGAVALALGLGVGAYSLSGTDGSEPVAATVAVAPESTPPAAPATPGEPEPEPTLQGAAPVLRPAPGAEQAKVGEGHGVESAPADAGAATGDPATDTISTSPAAPAADASASASASAATATVDGPPAGPAAIAVARKFADAFLVYETGGEDTVVRKALGATATPELTRALLRRPPLQPAAFEVPKAKVLNIVPAPSHGKIYPLSVSLLRIGTTSELRVEMEHLKSKGWRVTNVLG